MLCRHAINPVKHKHMNMADTHNTNVVFIDTNLDTHLALVVSDLDTVSCLKKRILSEHLSCFPKIGQIQIHGMKVKRKGYFYHLSDSMLVKSAFSGCNKGWFLSVDVSVLSECAQNDQLLSLGPPNQAVCVGIASNGLIGHGDDAVGCDNFKLPQMENKLVGNEEIGHGDGDNAVGYDNFKLPQMENKLVGNEEIAVASLCDLECTAKEAVEELDAGVKSKTGIPLAGSIECKVDGPGTGIGDDCNVCEENTLLSVPSSKKIRKSKRRKGDTVRGDNLKDGTGSVDNTLSFQSKGASLVTNKVPDSHMECEVDVINEGIKDACIVREEENCKSVSNVKKKQTSRRKKEDTVPEDSSKVNDVSVVGSGDYTIQQDIEAVTIPSENADKEVIKETEVLEEHQHTDYNNNKNKNDIDADVSMKEASEPGPAAKKKSGKRKRSSPVDSVEMFNAETESLKDEVQKSDEAPEERKESKDQFELENKKSVDDKATEDILGTGPPAKRKKRSKEKGVEESLSKASRKDELQKSDEAPKERKESKEQFELENKKSVDDMATEDILDTRPPTKKKKRSKEKGGEKSLSKASPEDEVQKSEEAPKDRKESKEKFELDDKKSVDYMATEDTGPPAEKKKRRKEKGGEKGLSKASPKDEVQKFDEAPKERKESEDQFEHENKKSADVMATEDISDTRPPAKKKKRSREKGGEKSLPKAKLINDLNVDNASHHILVDQQKIKNTNADQSAEQFSDTDTLKSSVQGRRKKGKSKSSNPPVVTSLKKDEEADDSSIQRGVQEEICEDGLFSKDISMSKADIDITETRTDACKEGIQSTEKRTGNYKNHSDIEIQACTSDVDEPMQPTEDNENVVLDQFHENGIGQIEGADRGIEVSPQNDPKLMLLEKATLSNQDNTDANMGELNVTSAKRPSLSSDSGMTATPSVAVTRNRKSARKKSTKTILETVKDSVRLEPSDSQFISGTKDGARVSKHSPGEKDDNFEASSKTDEMLVDKMNGTDWKGIETMAGKNVQGLEATDWETHAEDLSSSQQLLSKEQIGVRIHPGMEVPNVRETGQDSKLSGMSDSTKQSEHFPVSNSKVEGSIKMVQNKTGKDSRSKVRGVVSKTQQKKSLLAGEIFQDDNTSASEDEVDNSDASTRSPSDKPLLSDFSGDSSSDSHDGKRQANGGRSSLKASFADSKGISIDRLLRSSSRFKKARTIASQLEERESQPEFVPDSLFD